MVRLNCAVWGVRVFPAFAAAIAGIVLIPGCDNNPGASTASSRDAQRSHIQKEEKITIEGSEPPRGSRGAEPKNIKGRSLGK